MSASDTIPSMHHPPSSAGLAGVRDWGPFVVRWGSIAQAVVGTAYLAAVVVGILRGVFAIPLPDWLQAVGAITTMFEAPLLVIVVAGLGASAGTSKRALAVIAACFTSLFALSVSINRFSQLGVVRQSAAQLVAPPGMEWFLPYGANSIMLGLEYLGWGWFLGLGMIFTAGLLGESRLDRSIRMLAFAYGVLGIASCVGFLIPNGLSILGFVAWGPILLAIATLLAIRSVAMDRRLKGRKAA